MDRINPKLAAEFQFYYLKIELNIEQKMKINDHSSFEIVIFRLIDLVSFV